MGAVVLAAGFAIAGVASMAGAATPAGYDPGEAPSNAISFDIEGCRLTKATEGTYHPPTSWICDSSASWPDGADARL